MCQKPTRNSRRLKKKIVWFVVLRVFEDSLSVFDLVINFLTLVCSAYILASSSPPRLSCVCLWRLSQICGCRGRFVSQVKTEIISTGSLIKMETGQQVLTPS